jgi:hypothetical protein
MPAERIYESLTGTCLKKLGNRDIAERHFQVLKM